MLVGICSLNITRTINKKVTINLSNVERLKYN